MKKSLAVTLMGRKNKRTSAEVDGANPPQRRSGRREERRGEEEKTGICRQPARLIFITPPLFFSCRVSFCLLNLFSSTLLHHTLFNSAPPPPLFLSLRTASAWLPILSSIPPFFRPAIHLLPFIF